ncbi:hypothetical protein B0H13DRAFT_2427650 [Mycena leptocephala]|nr:hypothetical protein B0H13DRAFT_2427650 [Mycena leptocephala]
MAKIGIAALAINSDTVGKVRMRNEDIWTGSDRMLSSAESSRRIAGIITPTAQRWKNLDVEVDSFFKDVPPGTFQALERLSIRDFSAQTSPLTAFQSSPRLRTFTLKVAGQASKINLIYLPWWQLTHLCVEDNSLARCRTALLQCNNLLSAKLYTSYQWDLTPEATQSPIIVLPSLETLIMTFNGKADSGPVDGLEAFFMPPAVPSLIKIDFTFDPDEEEDWPAEVFSKLQSRTPKIKEILLVNASMDADGLIALLRHGPSLTALSVHFSWNSVDDTAVTEGFLDQKHDVQTCLSLWPLFWPL